MGALLNALYQLIYMVAYNGLVIFWQVVRAVFSVAVIVEGVNQWIIANVGALVALVAGVLAAPLGAALVIAIAALGAWYLVNNIMATKKWVDPGQLVIYGFLTLFFFAAPAAVIAQMEEVRGLVQLNLASAMTVIEDNTTGAIFDNPADGDDAGLPPAVPDVMDLGAYAGTVDPFDLAALYVGISTLSEIDSGDFPAVYKAAYVTQDPTNLSFAGFEAFTQDMEALFAGVLVLGNSLLVLPAVLADHFLRLLLTLAAVILYLGAPLAMVLAYFVFTNALLVAYVRQYISLLIETFLTYLIVSGVILAMQAAAVEGIGMYVGASLLALVIYAWRILSAFKVGARGVQLFGGATLTGGASGTDLARTAVGGAGAVAAAATGTGLLAAAGALAAGAQAAGRAADPQVVERDRRLKVLAGYAYGSAGGTGRVLDAASRVQGLARTVVVPPDQQQPNALDYVAVGNVAALNSSPFYRMGLDRGFGEAFNRLGGRQRYWGGAVDPGELGPHFYARQQWEQARPGVDAAAYPDARQEQAYQAYRAQRAEFARRRAYERAHPGEEVPGYDAASERAYAAWRAEQDEFEERWSWEQTAGRRRRRGWPRAKERRYEQYTDTQTRLARAPADGSAGNGPAGSAGHGAAGTGRSGSAGRGGSGAGPDGGWHGGPPNGSGAGPHGGDGGGASSSGGPAPAGSTAPRRRRVSRPPQPPAAGDGAGAAAGAPARAAPGWSSDPETESASHRPTTGSGDPAADGQEPAGRSAPAGAGAATGAPTGRLPDADRDAPLPVRAVGDAAPTAREVRVTGSDVNDAGLPAGDARAGSRLSLAAPGAVDLAGVIGSLDAPGSPAAAALAEATSGRVVERLAAALDRPEIGASGLHAATAAVRQEYERLAVSNTPAADILAAFRDPATRARLAAASGVALSDLEWAAVTDAVLQPRRVVAPAELAAAAARVAAQGELSDRAVAAELGLAGHFGGRTPLVRDFLGAIYDLDLPAAELAAAAAEAQRGAIQDAAARLAELDVPARRAGEILRAARHLPPLDVSQTAAYAPGDRAGYAAATGESDA